MFGTPKAFKRIIDFISSEKTYRLIKKKIGEGFNNKERLSSTESEWLQIILLHVRRVVLPFWKLKLSAKNNPGCPSKQYQLNIDNIL